ncbi:MAG: MCE family protein [Nitrospira sp.]|nr:MCE family protein [Nitrospira sp.]
MDIRNLPEVRPHRTWGWSVQLVWIVPIIAAAIAGWLVIKTIREKGPTITITFKTAEGLEAGKTKVAYKNVDIGRVKAVRVSDDLRSVIATVELDKNMEPYLVEDTLFWVVRPRVAGGQVSGLMTLFSGSHIGVDIGHSTTLRQDFVGLEIAPVVTGDTPGRQFVLRSQTLGSLQVGSPVFFRQEEVGKVIAHAVDQNGKGVTSKVFIDAPYDRYVTAETRFWNASGVDVSLDASGVKIDTQSLVSILIGGVAFGTPPGTEPGPDSEQPAAEGQEFRLASTREEAMKHRDLNVSRFVLYFPHSLRGLFVGAPVDFRGIVVGEVKSMNFETDESNTVFRFPVEVELYPSRLVVMMKRTAPNFLEHDEQIVRKRWDQVVANGFRAQLGMGNLLTGQLYVALDFFPGAAPAKMDWMHDPPAIPTIPGITEEIQNLIVHLSQTLRKFPLQEIGTDMRKTLHTLTSTLERSGQFVEQLQSEVTPEVRIALDEMRRALKTAERTLASESPTQVELQNTLRELGQTAESIRLLSDYLERHPEALLRGKREGGR